MSEIEGSLLQIDGNTVPSLKAYTVSYQKVWKDQTVNMAGDVRSTLLGINTILSVEFGGELLTTDMATLLPLLESDYFLVTFYDPKTDNVVNADYYCDGYDVSLLSKYKGRFEPIAVDFYPVSRSA